MTDIDVVQRVLEGRCIQCSEVLPKHDLDCELHPARTVTEKLQRLNDELTKKLDNLKILIDENKITVDELIDMIDEITANRFND